MLTYLINRIQSSQPNFLLISLSLESLEGLFQALNLFGCQLRVINRGMLYNHLMEPASEQGILTVTVDFEIP